MTTNPTYKPSEGKREEFRKYLEKNGIMDALTKVLVNLYEEVEKPEDALQYILDKLSIQAGFETQKQLNSKIEELQNRIRELEEEVEQLKSIPKIEEEGEGEVPAEDIVPQEENVTVMPEAAEDQAPPDEQ